MEWFLQHPLNHIACLISFPRLLIYCSGNTYIIEYIHDFIKFLFVMWHYKYTDNSVIGKCVHELGIFSPIGMASLLTVFYF